MKILKMLTGRLLNSLFFLAVILLVSCEKEPIENLTPEVFHTSSSFSESTENFAQQDDAVIPFDHRSIDSEEEYNSLCSDKRVRLEHTAIGSYGEHLGLPTPDDRYYYHPRTYFGATLKDVSTDGAGITISIYHHSTKSNIYEQTFNNSEAFYWGIATNERITIHIRGNGPSNDLYVISSYTGNCDYITEDRDGDGVNGSLDNCPDTANPDQKDHDQDEIGDDCDVDDDNDGIADADDLNPHSNMEASITIGNCDTGVSSSMLENGVTMADLIDELESGDYKNLGQEIKSYTQLTNSWIKMGFLTADQKNALLGCAQE